MDAPSTGPLGRIREHNAAQSGPVDGASIVGYSLSIALQHGQGLRLSRSDGVSCELICIQDRPAMGFQPTSHRALAAGDSPRQSDASLHAAKAG